MSLVNGFLICMNNFIRLLSKTHIFQILFVMFQSRVSLFLHFLVTCVHLLFDKVLIGDLCSQAVLTLFLVALEALNVKFEEIAVILKLLFSGDAHSPRFLILVTVIIILVIVLFTLIQLLGIPFHLVVRVQIIINQLTV